MIVTAAARPTSIRAILFDLDDTLIDHTSAAHNAATAWARELGLPGDQTDRWFAIERQYFSVYERGECTHQQQRRNRVRDFLGDFSLDDAATDALFAHFLTLYEQHWHAFPDAAPALTRALEAGLQVGILTNGATELQQRKLKRTGLDISGVQLLTSTGLGAAKPNPECYERALAVIGTTAHETFMVGDSLANDVEGARAVGMTAFHLVRDHSSDDLYSLPSLDLLPF